jgi:hypothetical protein
MKPLDADSINNLTDFHWPRPSLTLPLATDPSDHPLCIFRLINWLMGSTLISPITTHHIAILKTSEDQLTNPKTNFNIPFPSSPPSTSLSINRPSTSPTISLLPFSSHLPA